MIKLVIILMLAAILASLFSALYSLMNHKGDSTRTVRALTLRISLSITLFILLFAAFHFGLIQPHGVAP